MRKIAFFLLAALLFLSGCAPEKDNESFGRAKKTLETEIYDDHRLTLYCGAEFDEDKRVSLPEGFSSPGQRSRSGRVEWEHAVPVENFGRAFSEWRDGAPGCVNGKGRPFRGRRCARKTNAEFRLMECDLYNLFPAIGSVNAMRADKRYGMVEAGENFGSCEAKLGPHVFEPPDRAKGQVARASLYMAARYPKYHLSQAQRRLFEAWDREFPPDEWECRRGARIARLQGNENPWIEKGCGR